MALVLKDRVRETATVVGTGDAALLGAVTGFQSFAVVGNTNTCYYAIADQSGGDWEVGIGTYSTTGPTLARTTVLASSNSGSKVVFTGGTKDVFLTYPSERAVYLDENGNLDIEGSVIINANTSSAALRITQTGTGNALLVEDSANPDSTPFVIDASGNVITGAATQLSGYGFAPKVQVIGSTVANASILLQSTDRSVAYPIFNFGNAASSNNGVVSSGDILGQFRFYGGDGTSPIRAAQIAAEVDGTPGTNDMPGRLVFSTTADGASSPTERMRIGSNGTFGYNIANAASVGQYNYFAALSGTNVYGNLNTLVAASGTTASIRGYNTNIGTAAASFTLGNSYHYLAGQGTVGAGSAITNQYGFYSDSSLTGATNNFGFFSNIASGAGRFNFYAAGSADNFFAGKVGVGAAPTGGVELFQSGGQTTSAITTNTNIESFFVARQNSASAGAGGGIIFGAQSGSFAAIKGLLTNGTGNSVGDLAFSTRNATGDSTLTERMRIDSAGRVGIGVTPNLISLLNVAGTYPSSGGASNPIRADGTIPSSSTTVANIFFTGANTQAAAFTLPTLRHFAAGQGTIGVGSTVTTQIGFEAQSSLTGATNNFGFYSNIASGTGRYNFYAAGSADNYFAGRTYIASTSANALDVTGGVKIGSSTATTAMRVLSGVNWNFSNADFIRNAANTGNPRFIGMPLDGDDLGSTTIGAYNAIWGAYDSAPTTGSTSAALNGAMVYGAYAGHRWVTNGTERMRIDSAGRVGIGGIPDAGKTLLVTKNITGSAFSSSVYGAGQIQSDVTARADVFASGPSTAASITVPIVNHFLADQVYKGSGASVTNQQGFHAGAGLTGATNNYGFYSNIASGTGRWNFYAAGTADNYFAGNVSVGQQKTSNWHYFGTTYSTPAIQSSGAAPGFGADISIKATDATASTAPIIWIGKSNTTVGGAVSSGWQLGNIIWAGADGTNMIKAASVRAEVDGTPGTSDMPGRLIFSTTADGSDALTERMRIDSSGNVIQSAPTTAPALSTNGTMVFNLTSNTNLRVSVRGSDGVTRTANITLA